MHVYIYVKEFSLKIFTPSLTGSPRRPPPAPSAPPHPHPARGLNGEAPGVCKHFEMLCYAESR